MVADGEGGNPHCFGRKSLESNPATEERSSQDEKFFHVSYLRLIVLEDGSDCERLLDSAEHGTENSTDTTDESETTAQDCTRGNELTEDHHVRTSLLYRV